MKLACTLSAPMVLALAILFWNMQPGPAMSGAAIVTVPVTRKAQSPIQPFVATTEKAASAAPSHPTSDRRAAVHQLIERNDAASRAAFPHTMTAWAMSDPLAALSWWHGEENDQHADAGWHVDSRFYDLAYTALAKSSLSHAVTSLQAPDTLEGRLAATNAVARVAAAMPGQFDWLLDHPPADEWTHAQRVILVLARGDYAQAQILAEYVTSAEEVAEIRPYLKKGFEFNPHVKG